MALWDEIKADLSKRYALESTRIDEFSLVLTIGEEARLQRVFVHRYHKWDWDFVEIRSAFGLASEFDAEKLLSDNLRLPIGAFAFHEGFFVLVHRMNLVEASPEWVGFVVQQLGTLADRIEASRGTDSF